MAAEQLSGQSNLCEAVQFERLLDLKQAGILLGVHHQTLKKWAIGGSVPALKVGNRWRFRASDLQAWVDAKVQWPQHSSERLSR
jgi:excisionase family DNA binding protein